MYVQRQTDLMPPAIFNADVSSRCVVTSIIAEIFVLSLLGIVSQSHNIHWIEYTRRIGKTGREKYVYTYTYSTDMACATETTASRYKSALNIFWSGRVVYYGFKPKQHQGPRACLLACLPTVREIFTTELRWYSHQLICPLLSNCTFPALEL